MTSVFLKYAARRRRELIEVMKMDGYISDKEQMESIKKWWDETGKYIAIAVVIGLLIGFAWRYWQKIQRHMTDNASAIYQSALVAETNHETTTAQGGIAMLKKDFSNSPYASLAALLAAKMAVANNQLPQAVAELRWVMENGKEPRLLQIAHIQSARILIAEKKSQEALTELNTVQDKSFLPLIEWVKGDAYTQLHNAADAQRAYQKAYDALYTVAPAQALLQKQLAQ